MSGFNLVTDGWVPCLDESGVHTRLGVRDILRRSTQIREVSHPSPLVTASIHRFLLALVHRTHGPRDEEEWARLWKAGAWDSTRLDAYLDTWGPRFELLEGSSRFYQSDRAAGAKPIPIAKLAVERAAGNNATLFDHTPVEQSMPPAEAACYLIATHAFAIGGLVTPTAGERSSKDSHLVRGAVAVVRGRNLFETLLLNLRNYPSERDDQKGDRPAWETDAGPPTERRPLGWLDLLTWQSRRILLHAADGQVTGAALLKGDSFPEDWQPKDLEFMVAYRTNPNARPREEPFPPVRISPGRALWRDCRSIFVSIHGTEGLGMLRVLADRREVLKTGSGQIFPIDMMGISKDQAKPLLWRHERLPLPYRLLGDASDSQAYGEKLRLALESAETAGTLLRKTMFRLATFLVKAPGGPLPSKGTARGVLRSLYDEGQYWQRLEEPFVEFMYQLASEAPEADAALDAWIGWVRDAAKDTFRRVVTSLGDSVAALRASSLVTPTFFSGLRTVGGESS